MAMAGQLNIKLFVAIEHNLTIFFDFYSVYFLVLAILWQ